MSESVFDAPTSLPAAPSSYQEAIRLDRSLRSSGAEGLAPLRIVLGGNANLDFLKPALRVQLAAEGFDAVARTSAFGNWITESFDASEAGDVWVIWMSGMGATRGMTERPEVDVDSIAAAAQRILARGAKIIFVHPEPMPLEDEPFSPFTAWRHDLIERLRTGLPSGVVQLSVDHLVRRIGMSSWAASRYWEQAKAACHPDAATAVGNEIAVVVARLFRPAIRAIAVDLDDTLWGGLVGEVGPAGLDLDPDGTGRPYLELQRLLLDLSDRGIAVGVVSKNDDAEARRPFKERPEMLLSLDSLVRFDVSWRPKYEGITKLAEELNIGIDSVCLLDDSAEERDEARRMLPSLVVPELPVSPARRVEHLLRSRLFTTPLVSAEDRLRSEFFRRAAIPTAIDLDGYLASLEMSLEAISVGAPTIDRVLSLLHKTNQFNLTLWRPTPTDLATFLADEHNYAYSFRLTDRLGDAGIISVLLVTTHADRARIAAWVMSCRVFTRGVEWAVIDHLSRWMAKHGLSTVDAPYTEGPRNGLVGDVLRQVGLQAGRSDDRVTWFSAEGLTPPRHHITIVDR